MTVRPEQPNRHTVLWLTLSACLCALLLYTGLWGSLCSMAYLATRGILPLLAGGAAALAVCCLAKQRKASLVLTLVLLPAAAALFLLRLQTSIDGVGLLLNRLFQASERVQPYLYDKFPVTAAELSPIDAALLPLGLLSGTLLGWIAGRRLRVVGVLVVALLLFWMAWLGLYPRPVWLLVLAAGAVLLLLPQRTLDPLRLLWLGLTAALLLTVAALCFPAQNPALQAWSEQARDALAPQTVYYSDQLPPKSAPEAETPQPGREYLHESQQNPEVPEMDLRPLWIGLLLLGLLLLLFIPSVLADRLRKQRAQARAGLADPDNAVCIRASFLYAMRLLQCGGLSLQNEPYSRCVDAFEERFSTLRDPFCAVLPLWQEAAYSDHPMRDEQREQMQRFLAAAKAEAFARMRPLTRLRTRLLY